MVMRLLKQRFSEAAAHEDLAPVSSDSRGCSRNTRSYET
jgi:hypothetical protein